MAIQVSQASLLAHHTGLLKASVSSLALLIHHNGEREPIDVSHLSLLAHHNGQKRPVSTSAMYMLVHRSLDIILVAELLESSPEVDTGDFSLFWDFQTPAPVQVPEINPYRPTVPESFEALDPTLFEFQRETQEQLRRQHNLIQAGDTTFPWEMLTKVEVIPLFRLGSLGRFYHEDHGVIQARYCQFRKMRSDLYNHAPVGSLRTLQKNPWIVTNQLSWSHRDSVLGISAGYTIATEGQYGWVVVEGCPWFSIGTNKAGVGDVGVGFSWDSDGSVNPDSEGRFVVRRVGVTDTQSLPPGSAYVRLEGLGAADVRRIAGVTAINDSISDLWDAINVLQAVDDSAQINDLQNQLNLLKQTLELQIKALQITVNAIQSQDGNGLSESEVQALIDETVSALNLLIGNVDSTAQSALVKANQALALLAGLATVPSQILALQDQLNYVIDQLNELIDNPTPYRPVTTGEIPPILMYNPDGSLIVAQILSGE